MQVAKHRTHGTVSEIVHFIWENGVCCISYRTYSHFFVFLLWFLSHRKKLPLSKLLAVIAKLEACCL
jgi:hypothetical protein